MTAPRNARDPVDVSGSESEQLSPARVSDLLGLLAKSVRAQRLYQANNPVYQQFTSALRAAFTQIWDETRSLRLTVEENAFRWTNRTFAAGEDRDNLAFFFYQDGLRRLTFLPGFEDEVGTFLRVVQRAQKPGQTDSLITLLWEADLTCFHYEHIDPLADVAHVPEDTEREPEPGAPALILTDLGSTSPDPGEADPDSAPAESAAPTITREDFDETLYFLDEKELAILRAELEREWRRDLKADVLNALFDRLEDPEPARQDEIIEILQQLLLNYLASGRDLRAAASILKELHAILDRASTFGDPQRARATAIFDDLSEPGNLEQLISLVEQRQIEPGADDIGLFLAYLRPKALPTLLRAASTTREPEVAKRLQHASEALARNHTAELGTLLESADPVVAIGAAKLAGKLELTSEVPRLAALIRHGEPQVRQAVVLALAGMPSAAGVNAIIQTLEDEDRDVRIAAARAIGHLRYRPARLPLEEALQSRRIRDADLTEKVAFFEACGALAAPESVAVLDRILNGRDLLRRAQPSELRACAALGLGLLGIPAARRALQRALNDKDPVVRRAVARAVEEKTPA